MIQIDKSGIDEIYTMTDAIMSVRKALVMHEKGETQIPVRTSLDIASKQGTCLFMPGMIESMNLIGVKIVSVYPGNAKKGLENVPSEMILLDGETGYVKTIINGTRLTEIRTGAVSAIASDIICPANVKKAAMIGTGGQAPSQIEGLLTVRNIDTVNIAARSHEKTIAFANEMNRRFGKRFGTEFIACKTVEEAVEEADIVTTATTSKTPVINRGMLKDNVHINAVGSFRRDMQEIHEDIIGDASFILVDNLQGVLKEAGDLLIPMEKGIIEKKDFSSELGSFVSGKKKYISRGGVTVFETVGFGALDLVVANDILNKFESKI
ncbi:MAG: ornithine cyclodeaminase family protein [Clostridiales bacterium]|nr:MAG: ornithine cyclodeaminase family protein [Clostridiales bacterium]